MVSSQRSSNKRSKKVLAGVLSAAVAGLGLFISNAKAILEALLGKYLSDGDNGDEQAGCRCFGVYPNV